MILMTSSGSSAIRMRSSSSCPILPLGQHRFLEPAEEAAPVGAADQDDRELGDLAGGDEGEGLEHLVHRAEAAGEDHEGLGVLDEDGLPDEATTGPSDSAATPYPVGTTGVNCLMHSNNLR
jgi:hypothetical protein